MTEALFTEPKLTPYKDDLHRNIKSLRQPQDLYDDLSDDPHDWEIAQKAEMEAKPPYGPSPTIIHRPFHEALFFDAIGFPFEQANWTQSRFSSGRYGVWYGSDALNTTIYETAYHWKREFIDAPDFAGHEHPIISERRVFLVACQALLFDFRAKVDTFPDLVHKHDYHYTHRVGERIHYDGFTGLINRSARCAGDVFAIFKPNVLNNPRDLCYLTYHYQPDQPIEVSREQGHVMLSISPKFFE